MQLFNKGYLTKKEYTTGSPSSFIEGLVKNIRDYSVDQVIKMSNNEQTDFVPFFTWSKSTAGKSANTGQSGNTSQSTTNKNKSSQISTNVDLKLTDSQQAALDINAFFFDAIGRKATKEEQAAYHKELNDAERRSVSRTVAQANTLSESNSNQNAIVSDTANGTAGTNVVSGTDKSNTSRSSTTIGGNGLGQQDYNRIQSMILAPVLDKMTTAQILATNGNIAKSIVNLQGYAADYAIPSYTADVAKKDIVNKIKAGNITSAQAEEPEQLAIRTMAKAYYPNLSKQIDLGVKVSSLAHTMAAHVERTLGLEANSVDNNNPYVIKALQNKNADGAPQDGIMNIHDFEKELRADPRWASTDAAKEEASSYVNSILSSFGLVK